MSPSQRALCPDIIWLQIQSGRFSEIKLLHCCWRAAQMALGASAAHLSWRAIVRTEWRTSARRSRHSARCLFATSQGARRRMRATRTRSLRLRHTPVPYFPIRAQRRFTQQLRARERMSTTISHQCLVYASQEAGKKGATRREANYHNQSPVLCGKYNWSGKVASACVKEMTRANNDLCHRMRDDIFSPQRPNL